MKNRVVTVIGIMMVLTMIAGFTWADCTSGGNNTCYGVGSGSSNTTGSENTLLGYNAGHTNQTGTRNNFIGASAGYTTNEGNGSNVGSYNSFIGAQAGYFNSTGHSNIFIGDQAGYSNTDGYYNTYIGDNAGINNNGSFNAFLGGSAGQTNTSGSFNTFIGVVAGASNAIGHNNVFIGAGAGFAETNSNRLYIDNCSNAGPPATSCTSQPLIYGEFDTRVLQVNGTLIMTALATPSDERLKKNIEPLKSSLDKVMHLQGVSYEWKAEENPGRGFIKGRDIGLIAQSAEAVIPEIVFTDSKGYKALSYDKIVPVLVEAIKEQQKIVDGQKEALAEKSRLIDEQKKTLDSLIASVNDMKSELKMLKSRNLSAQK